jgi:hypothetical protein
MSVMSSDASPTRTSVRVPTRKVLRPMAAFIGISLALVAFFVAAGAPTPLLVIYQREWGFAPWVLTVAFGVYAFGLLAALLVVGSLSDYVGRRPVLIGSLGLELVSMVMFLMADNIGWVIVARVIQGLATGAATSAFTAAVIELAPPRRKRLGAVVGSVSPAGGLGIGALAAGVLAQVSASATSIVWGALVVVMAVGIVVALLAADTAEPRSGAAASLRPRIRVPVRARRQFAAAVPALVGSWMMAALFMGLGPTILGAVFGIHNVGIDGATSSIEPLVAAAAAFLIGSLAAHKTLIVGAVSVIVGAALVIVATATGVLPLLLLGGAIGGVGFGATFSGALRGLAPLAQGHERAGLFAAIFMVSYLAFGLPAIVAGQLVAPLGVLSVAAAFGAVIVVAAAIGLDGQIQLLRHH